TEPGGAQSGRPLSPQPVLRLEDAEGNLVSSESSRTVTLTLTDPQGATLAGARTVRFTNGIATFTNLVIKMAGTYTLTAKTTAGSFGAESDSLVVTPGPAASLAFATQPVGAAAGAPLSQQPTVVLKDRNGNVVTTNSVDTVTLTLTLARGAVLSGPVTLTVEGGVAAFDGLTVDMPGTYTLTARTSAGTFSKTSTSFQVT
ncbi:MAG TPA: hypothetical protein VHI93_09590, partial [Candidatus Thermoplasmatota archaeon]|nr:hypothetical protein [Candidatus Thermoplasmatota archaeon]